MIVAIVIILFWLGACTLAAAALFLADAGLAWLRSSFAMTRAIDTATCLLTLLWAAVCIAVWLAWSFARDGLAGLSGRSWRLTTLAAVVLALAISMGLDAAPPAGGGSEAAVEGRR